MDLNLKGKFHIAVYNGDKVVDERDIYNTVMNAGKAQVAGLILTDIGTGSVGAAFDYVALGTGTTTPNVTQTALVGEKYRSAGTGSRTTVSVTNDTARITASVTCTAANTITEAAVFNSASAGVMLARTTFSGLSVVSGNSINIGYDIQVS